MGLNYMKLETLPTLRYDANAYTLGYKYFIIPYYYVMIAFL